MADDVVGSLITEAVDLLRNNMDKLDIATLMVIIVRKIAKGRNEKLDQALDFLKT